MSIIMVSTDFWPQDNDVEGCWLVEGVKFELLASATSLFLHQLQVSWPLNAGDFLYKD